jgi:hypothetical protein
MPANPVKRANKKEVISQWGDNLFLQTAFSELHLYTQGNTVGFWIT